MYSYGFDARTLLIFNFYFISRSSTKTVCLCLAILCHQYLTLSSDCFSLLKQSENVAKAATFFAYRYNSLHIRHTKLCIARHDGYEFVSIYFSIPVCVEFVNHGSQLVIRQIFTKLFGSPA